MDKIVLPLLNNFANDFRIDGLTLLRDVPLVGSPALGLVSFMKASEPSLYGGIALLRAKKLGNMAGQRHAERLLSMKISSIPEVWREFELVFPGTVWSGKGGRSVPYLTWWFTAWRLAWCPATCRWSKNARFVRICQP